MYTTPLPAFEDYQGRDGSITGLDLGRHHSDVLGVEHDTQLLAPPVDGTGFLPPEPLLFSDDYMDESSPMYLSGQNVTTQLQTESSSESPQPSNNSDTIDDASSTHVKKLHVGLYHKTRGGRNTFGAIPADAMVRVTKGVGKRLQLRVEFTPSQQLFVRERSGLSNTALPFRWENFSIALEELSLKTGEIVAEKMCEMDMTELLTVVSFGQAGEEPTYAPASEPYHLTLDSPPLIAQCELKLFHLCKTLRFRVEYLAGDELMSGCSLTFFTHDSGKSKRVAFNANSSAEHVPSSIQTSSSTTSPAPTAPQQQFQAMDSVVTTMPSNENYPYPHPAATQHFMPFDSKHEATHTYYMDVSEDSTNLEASSSSSGSALLTPSDSSTLMDTDTLSRDFTSDHETSVGSFFPTTPRGAPNHASYPSTSSSQQQPSSAHASHQPQAPYRGDGNQLLADDAAAEGDHFMDLHPNHQQPLHEELHPRHRQPQQQGSLQQLHQDGSVDSSGVFDGSYSASPSGSYSSSTVPFSPVSASASSSLSSDEGSGHMHAHFSRRSSSSTGKPRKALRRSADASKPRSHQSSTSASPSSYSKARIQYDAIDEDIDRQLAGRSASKKRKAHEEQGGAVPVASSSSGDFPTVVDSSLDVKGVVRAQAFVHFSDIRFKTNVEDITDALNIVRQLRGKKYEWKDTINGAPTSAELSGGRKVIGLIAQEVKRVLPECVVADKNGYLSLNYTDMVPVLIEALKQHVEENKQEKSELKDSISELRAMVDELSQRSADTLTDTSSYVDFSDDDDLEGSFQDEDWDLSDSHGSYSRSSIPRSSYRRLSRTSSVSSASSLGGNEGDLTASSASLPDDVGPLGNPNNHAHHGSASSTAQTSKEGSDSRSTNANAPPKQGKEKMPPARKIVVRKHSANAVTVAPRPYVTLVACMAHKRLTCLGSQNSASQASSSAYMPQSPAPFTVVSAPSQQQQQQQQNYNQANIALAPRKSESAGLARSEQTPVSRSKSATTVSTHSTVSSSGPLASSSPTSSSASNTGSGTLAHSTSALTMSSNNNSTNNGGNFGAALNGATNAGNGNGSPLSSSGVREKEKESAPSSTKRTATQRLSRGFTSLLHHIQASTSNIMNSAANFTKGSSSSSNNSNNSQTQQASSPSSDDGLLSDGESPNLASSSSSISSSGSSTSASPSSSSSVSLQGSASGNHSGSTYSLAQQISALSLNSSTSDVRAQVLAPGFARLSPAAPVKIHRAIHRAVVITVSAWHMWANSDQEKLFLDASDARHSLIMSGKAVAQIEASFPECSYIHTVSIDMRGTVLQTVEDVMLDLQRKQVPSGDLSSSTPTTTTTKDGTTTTTSSNASAAAIASVQSQLEQADLVWFIGHTQGIQVCVHVCERLLRSGVLSSGEQLINVLSLGGLHQTCTYSLMSLHGNPAIYAGLHNFGNSRRNFREYKMCLAKLLELGVPITTVGAYQDSMVSMTSASLEYVKHPNILRSLLVHHEFKEKFDPKHTFKKASNFTQELTRFALEMRNKNRVVDMLAFVNTNDANTDVQEMTTWISHAKAFPRDKLHPLLYSPHVEFPATVPGFYYALGATMSMFNTRAFRFHKVTRQLREGIQRHREIPFAQDCYRVSIEWLLTRVSQGMPAPTTTASAPSTPLQTPTTKKCASHSAVPTPKSSSTMTSSSPHVNSNHQNSNSNGNTTSSPIAIPPSTSNPANHDQHTSSQRQNHSSNEQPVSGGTVTAARGKRTKKRDNAAASTSTTSTPPALAYPPLIGVAAVFKDGGNGFSYDFAEQVQLIASQCSKLEVARLQSAFRYWRPEGPREAIIQKLVTRSLGWTVAETPTLAQYVDGLSEIVGSEKDRDSNTLASSSPPASSQAPLSTSPSNSSGHGSPRGGGGSSSKGGSNSETQ